MFRFNIRTLRALRGPNRYSSNKSVFMLIDFLEYGFRSTGSILNFTNKIFEYFPSFSDIDNTSSYKYEFIERLKNGTDLSDVILNIAIELLNLSGQSVEKGNVFKTKEQNVNVIVYNYLDENSGLDAAEEAVILVESIINNVKYDVGKTIYELRETQRYYSLNANAQYLVDEALKRGIPFIRLNKHNYVQLGYGRYQKKIESAVTSATSALGIDIISDSNGLKDILREGCIPVPDGAGAKSYEEALKIVENISFPIVIKPGINKLGQSRRGITVNIKDFDKLKPAFESAILINENVLVEKYLLGKQYNILVVNGKFTAASFKELLQENDLQNKLYTDVTDMVHPQIVLMVERTASLIGLDVMEVNLVCSDISKPLNNQEEGIVNVKADPDLSIYLNKDRGGGRNVTKPIIDMLFPSNTKHSIPVVAVTGTNGKTTVCKLIAHSLKYEGMKVGLTSTTGVEVDGTSIVKGDYSGPSGHEHVLRDATVDCAVLETARGGILRRGLIYNECDIGVLLNVGEDHIGNDLIESIEDLGELKATVVKAVKESGYSILNADDQIVMKHKDAAGGQKILFSLNPENIYLKEHVDGDGIAITVIDDKIILRTKVVDKVVAGISDVPITFNGTADFNISNALAAVGVLYGLGFKREKIQGCITTFYPSVKLNPGRMNIFDFNTFKVIVDYGHNKHAMDALSRMLPKLSKGRKIGICHGSGNRKDELLFEFAGLMAKTYDYIIVTDLDIRHRKLGETAEIVRQGILKTGFDKKSIEVILDIHEAIEKAFNIVKNNDVIVIQVDAIKPVIDDVMGRKKNKLLI